MPRKGQTKDGPAYNPITLFQEYAERTQADFNDPELDDLDTILRKLGFTVETKDQSDSFNLWQDWRLYKAFVITLLLVDSYGYICDSTGKIIAKTPVETELILTEKDAFFLRQTGIEW